MESIAIKNIVFDVGNVLVRYDPHFIIANTMAHHHDKPALVQAIFKEQTWFDLNLGLITEQEAIYRYHTTLGIEVKELQVIMDFVKESLTPIPGSIDLLKQLYGAFTLYALTDNTHEIISYLQKRYDFWPLFAGVVVSAEIGHLKPSKEIYLHLLNTYQLQPQETLFIDDVACNVAGAKALGIHTILFENITQCMQELKKLTITTPL